MTLGQVRTRPGTLRRPGVIVSPKERFRRVSTRYTSVGGKPYEQNVCILIQTNGRYTFVKNRVGVVPRLSYSIPNHVLRLASIKLRFGWLACNDNADLCR
jgi:hypothetical protein